MLKTWFIFQNIFRYIIFTTIIKIFKRFTTDILNSEYIYHFPYSSPNASTKVYDLLYFLPTVSIISITVSVLMSPAPYHCPTPYCGYWTSFPGHKVSFMKPPCLFWHPSPPPCPMTSHEILIINGISDNRSSWTRKILEVP